MDLYLKEFVEYLKYIKFLNEESSQSFIKLFNTFSQSKSQKSSRKVDNNNLNKDKNFNSIFTNSSPSKYDIIIRTIYNYLISLNENQLKLLSKGLIDGYNENKNKIKSKFIFRLLEIYQNKEIKYYLKKWKKILFYINKIEHIPDSNLEQNILNSKIGKNKKYKSNINKIINEKISENQMKTDDFINRQEKYYQKIQKAHEKAILKNEEEMQLLCSFSPQLNIKNRNIKSKYKYEGVKTENYPYKKKENDNKNINKNTKRSNTSGNSKIISQRLYNDYNKIQKRKKELQKEIDEERGITFKPKKFSNNSGYNINTNFTDRNKKLLEERKNFAFVYDYLRQKKYNEGKIGKQPDNELLQNYLMNQNYTNNDYNDLLTDNNANEDYEEKEN